MFLSTSTVLDYSDSTIHESFPAGSNTNLSCVTIHTFHDRIVEEDETFIVHLSTSDSASIDNATVIIKDDDGRPLFLIIQSYSYFQCSKCWLRQGAHSWCI